MAQDEIGFGLDMGDTVKFQKGKIGKQLKIAPTDEDIKKATPDRIEKKDIDMTITAKDKARIKRLRELEKKRKSGKVKD
jgi:hypothetical protein